MKLPAAVLLFTSALALALPAEQAEQAVAEIATGTCDKRGLCQGRFSNGHSFTRACTDGSCKGHHSWGCNVSTNVK
ncbi:hypothetical protein E4U42_003626 [Claviceps africana]|uniref:Antifungal protein n=1 Tax=Claviceps africana TaxID=83212 RepID=A0A8K0JI50_9HYPO|nr:hypothetical protein E4U42_003626 [Claviceps africana]